MDLFLNAATKAIERHGAAVTYKQVGTTNYNVNTSEVTSTDIDYSIKAYPKHIKANAYNYPDLIGKEAILFYISSASGIVPKQGDFILYNSLQFNVDSFQSHFANGAVVLYRVAAVRG